jgi:hypothetical protein
LGAILGGYANAVTAEGGICVGYGCQATGKYATAIGKYAHASNPGQFVLANGFGSTLGAGQQSFLSYTVQTNDATKTPASLTNDAPNTFTGAASRAILFELKAMAYGSDGKVAAWDTIKGLMEGTRLVGGYVKEMEHNQVRNAGDAIPAQCVDESSGVWKLYVSVDTSYHLKIEVQGAAGTVIWWNIAVHTVELKQPVASGS